MSEREYTIKSKIEEIVLRIPKPMFENMFLSKEYTLPFYYMRHVLVIARTSALMEHSRGKGWWKIQGTVDKVYPLLVDFIKELVK